MKKFFRRYKEDTFDVDDISILVPVGDHEKFVKKRPELKEVDIETWKHRLEKKNESLQREVDRLSRHEELSFQLIDLITQYPEIRQRLKERINAPVMYAKNVDYVDGQRFRG